MQFIKQTIKDLPFQAIAKTKSLDPRQAILLFNDPRGGSTWLAETLNHIPQSLIIDEPLDLTNSQAINKLKFAWRQYIPEAADWPEAKLFFEKILKGQLLNAGLCYRNSISEAIAANQLILKIIRGKALLPWLVNQFDFKYKPLLVIRHPFALAASQLAHSAWDYKYQKFSLPQSPHLEFYQKHISYLEKLESKEEQLTALWCMTNNVALKNAKNNIAWKTINYEDFVLQPERIFQEIFAEWELPLPTSLIENILQPSSTTVGKAQIQPEQLLSDWQNKLSEKQIDRLSRVLDYFEVDYYGQDIMPLIPAHKVHLS